MKKTIYLIGLVMAAVLSAGQAKAQLLDVKPWHGYYPEMNGTYPLSFIAFKGWLLPTPYLFVRTWPTHYYVESGAMPVSDSQGYADLLQINFLKLVSRLIEKEQMKERHQATTGIRDNTQAQQEIGQKLFDSRSDQLPDIYNIVTGFIHLYQSISRLDNLENCSWLRETLEKDADGLLTRFISVNLLQSDHGEKLGAFAGIRTELNLQIGDAGYTFRKVHYYQFYAREANRSYSVLTE